MIEALGYTIAHEFYENLEELIRDKRDTKLNDC